MYQELVLYFGGLPQVSRFLLVLAAALVIAKLIQEFSLNIVGRAINSRGNELGGIIHDELHMPVYVTVALTGAYAAIYIAEFQPSTNFYMEGVVITLATLVWTWALVRMGNRILEFVKESESTRFDYEFAPIFENLWTAVVVLVAIFWILSVWDIDITPFLASAGILGIVAGFAAKDTISNFFGGLALYFDNTYKLGDYVVLDTGEEGIVVDIGIRSTNLKTMDDMVITIPNAVLNSSKIINQSAPEKKGRLTVSVGVAYDSDIDLVEELLIQAAKDVPGVLDHPRPRVRFKEFGDHALEYDLYVWIPNPIEKFRSRHKLNREILKKFRKNDVEIPYPQRVIHYRQE